MSKRHKKNKKEKDNYEFNEFPDYYGYWFSENKINSIFFVYPSSFSTNEAFQGLIKDKFGRAKFFGEKNKKRIFFKKEYLENSHPFAAKDPLEYKGNILEGYNDIYEGDYFSKDEKGNKYSGRFIMHTFPKNSKTMEALLEYSEMKALF